MTSMVELGWPTYAFEEIKSIKELKEIFPNGVANQYNWVFLSQRCFHGTDETLDQVEAILLGEGKAQPVEDKWPITVLIVCPRTTSFKYGYIPIGIEDVEFLRGLVRSTLEVVKDSQKGNI